MRSLLSTTILLVFAACSQAQGAYPPIRGYVLATADEPAATKASQDLPFGATKPAFVKAFPSDRYRIVDWGDDRLVVIDLNTGPLGRLHDQRLVTQAFLDKREADGFLSLARMSPDEVEAARSALGGTWPGRPGHAVQPPSSLGLSLYTKVELTSGGRTKTIRLPPSYDQGAATLKKAQGRFGGSAAGSSRAAAPPARRDETTLRFWGTAAKAVPEGVALLAQSLGKIENELEEANRKSAEELLKAMGFAKSDDPDASKSVYDMPDSLRQGLKDMLSNSWQTCGFSSREEAAAFLAASDGYRVSTDVHLYDLLDPGDPASGRPASVFAATFLSVPGYRP
jgi:hypothetical protein